MRAFSILHSSSLGLRNYRTMLNIIHTLNECTGAIGSVRVAASWGG